MSTENPVPAPDEPQDQHSAPPAPVAPSTPVDPAAAQPTQPIAQVPTGASAQPTQPLPPTPPVQPARPAPHQAYNPFAQPGAYPAPAAHAHAPQPYPPQHAPGAFGPFGQATGPAPQQAPQHQPEQHPHGADGVPTATAVLDSAPGRQRPFWTPLIGTAAATALVVALATLGITGALDNDRSTTTPSALSTIGQSTTETVPVSGSSSASPDWQKVSAAVSASVVSIQVKTQSGEAEGSGVILDATGHILTNNHVVSGASNNTVQVTLTDGRIFDATIVGTDTTTDLAVIQLKDAPSDLSPAALGDSSTVVVGDPVMAVGNPLGLDNTATTGIVSALDRPVSASESGSSSRSETVVTNAIQIDAAINPGNSGGPLFDAEGRVVGITSSIATLSGASASSQSGSIGLGFAIPINLAKNIASQLVDKGTAEHAFLGVSLTDGTGTADGTTRRGAVIEAVSASSPASTAGLKAKDVVVAMDGKAVAGAESLTAFVRELSSGTEVTLSVIRDGKALDVKVTLAAKVETAPSSSSSGSGSSDGSGSSNGNGSSNGQGTDPFGWFGQQGQ